MFLSSILLGNMTPHVEAQDCSWDAALIPAFYSGRELLITGATGFIGQALTERLLSTCPGIHRLHLLVKAKKGDSGETRLSKFKEGSVFDVLRENNPKQLEKLNLIPGDMTRTDLGLNEKSIADLQNVSVVFHLAASVKMDEELEVAVKVNTLAAMCLLDICDRLPKMAAFIHVSTAYCHAERALIEETVYPLPIDLDTVIQESLHGGRRTKDELKRFISPKPNTYTFTKTLAETVMKMHGNRGYPVAIFRPTIVMSSLRAPRAGWVWGARGPGGVALAVSRGVQRVMACDPTARADLLPVDIAADTLVAIAWETALDNLPDVRVYNCSMGENSTTFGELFQCTMQEIRENPCSNTMCYPSAVLVANPYLLKIAEFVLETVPLHIADFILKIFGKGDKRMDLKAVSQRLVNMREVLFPFTTREYWFTTHNVRNLRARLSPSDAAIYNTDPASISWKQYYKDFTRGVKLHLNKDKEAGSPAARKQFDKLFYIHKAVSLFLLLLLAWLTRGVLLRVATAIADSLPGQIGRIATDAVLYLETF
ncbi:unnamed protein product [Chilo suppressalis]|uniref:Fatty acyl-CoA reductase n=1 Tax=Chilo suppressalis TaxID=168631 RepID=A0ABN8LAV8_CHISP|nr:unnamed protein product [Chilo suppressalis]